MRSGETPRVRSWLALMGCILRSLLSRVFVIVSRIWLGILSLFCSVLGCVNPLRLAFRSNVFVVAVDDEDVDRSVIIQIRPHNPGTVLPGNGLECFRSTFLPL